MENPKISVTVKLVGSPGKIVDGDDLDTHSQFEIVQIVGGPLSIATQTDGEQPGTENSNRKKTYKVDDVISADEIYAFKSMGVEVIRI